MNNFPKFTASVFEMQLISKIVTRLVEELGVIESPCSIIMDIEATHCNGNPIDLNRLLKSELSDFSHDVFGIMQHIDRMTGKLTGGFSPRCSLIIKVGIE